MDTIPRHIWKVSTGQAKLAITMSLCVQNRTIRRKKNKQYDTLNYYIYVNLEWTGGIKGIFERGAKVCGMNGRIF